MKILLYFWQLPQNLLGLLLVAILRPERKYIMDNGNIIYFAKRMAGGMSLGKYSIVASYHWRATLEEVLKRDTPRHEAIGHATQSVYLGWLYLPVIGLQSGLHAALCMCKTHKYRDMWFEKWADKIAGVER